MRLALKNTLAILVVYVVGAAAVAWWMASQWHALATSVAESTAQLVGGEVARALTGSALAHFQGGGEATHLRLEQIVSDVTERSSVLTSLAVVDRNGTVVAGDNVTLGRQLAIPELIFADDRRTRLIGSGGPFGGGEFYVLVPLLQEGDLAGYVRLTLRSQRIADLYRHAFRNLALVALAGLLFVAAAGVVLHGQLSRRSAALAKALEAAARGEAPAARHDEFARALDAARRIGRQLNEARGDRQQVEQRMGALLKALDTGVLVLEPDFRLGFTNDRAAELLGCREPGELAQRWEAEIQARLAPVFDRLARAGAGRHAEYELAANGSAPRLKLEFYALGEDACEGHLVLVKSAESIDALQNELGLAIQMRGLTRFYAAFAHDLKAPLNAMVLTLELLRHAAEEEGADGARREKQLHYVGVLHEEIGRLDRQLRTLLSHTAPPSEERQEVDLHALIRDLEALLAPQARRQHVTLSTRLPDAPVSTVGLADRLKQAMLNILINALEAMPDGGELSIDLVPCDGHARLTVRDTGPGIPPELLKSIYEMHFTTKRGGTGVGLYVARSVVAAHGGTITVNSESGQGTTFVIEIPAATGEAIAT